MLLTDIGALPVVMVFGILPAILAGAGLAGKLFGGASKNRSEGRARESDILTRRDQNQILADRNREQSLLGRADLDLNQRAFQENAPGQRLSQARTADHVTNLPGALENRQAFQTRTTPGGDRIFGGGLQPEDFSPSQDTQDLAGLIRTRALDAQTAGDQFDELPAFRDTQLSPLPQATGFDKFLNIGAGVGGILGSAGTVLGQHQRMRADQERRINPQLIPNLFDFEDPR